MAKKKKKTQLELLADAAVELNEALGLDPQIDTEDSDENQIAQLLREASELITPDDEISDETTELLKSIAIHEEEESEEETPEPEESESEDEPEQEEHSPEEEEDEGTEDEEELTLEVLREEVEGAPKRKDLRILVEEIEFFESLVDRLPELKSSAALKGAMLKLIDSELGDPEPEEEAEPELEEAKPAKPAKPKKEAKPAKPAKPKPKKKKGKGVIATIAQSIEDAGKKGITKDEILNILITDFPDRDATSMGNTINTQVPNRISKERFKVESDDKGRYSKV